MAKIPAGFEKIGADSYGPGKRGIIYRVTAENGVSYTVSRHEWVLPWRHWAWKAVPDGGGKTLYFDTLDDGEYTLFPHREEAPR